MPVKGGSRFKAHIRRQRRAVRLMPKGVSVGFHNPFASMVAAQNEFGIERPDSAGGDIPERPAFRRGIPDASAAVSRTLQEAGGVADASAVKDAAGKATDAIKRSYLGFHGAPASPSTVRRKAGTPGEGRQLVGEHGPRLIGLMGFRYIR